jgi:phosphoglycolate phosphatase
MNIFFDLDGTLLDSRKRLYTLFQDLVPESKLSIDEYWELKRNKINHKAILMERFNRTEDDFVLFEKEFLAKIESFDYLQFDTPVYGAYETLNSLARKNNLYIVTSRQSKKNVFDQLKKLDLYKYFNDILVTEHKCEKVELIGKLEYQRNDFIVGDTGYDILTGLKLGVHIVAVSYGFLNRQKLEEYKPEFIVDSLPEVVAILDQ